ncbi:MAG: hypothetical protein K2F72_05315 [Muribaculaceae bacterium]|nr:hypothetical protein [Muribaculaceae bacterium]
MRKTVTLIFLSLCTLAFAATPAEKKFDKIAAEYDIPGPVRCLSEPDGRAYWQLFLESSRPYLDFKEKMEKHGRTARKTEQHVADLPKFYPHYSPLVNHSYDHLCDSIMARIGALPADTAACRLYIINNDIPDAGLVPAGDDRWAIYISTGLLDTPGADASILEAIAAREYARFLLMQPQRLIYNETRPNAGAWLVGAALLGVMATSGADFDPRFDEIERNRAIADYVKENTAIIEQLKDVPPLMPYTMRYSKALTYEADLAALRLMQLLGNGPAYIEALKLQAPAYEKYRGRDNDGPTIQQRINFLSYIIDK